MTMGSCVRVGLLRSGFAEQLCVLCRVSSGSRSWIYLGDGLMHVETLGLTLL